MKTKAQAPANTRQLRDVSRASISDASRRMTAPRIRLGARRDFVKRQTSTS